MLPPVDADIDRLLDPSYKLSPPTNYLSLCIDHKGDLHDPDYRHFPISSRPSSPSRPKYYSHSPIPFYDDDEEDNDHEDEFPYFHPQQTRTTRRNYSPRYSPRSLISSPSSSYSTASSSSPSSLTFEDTHSYSSSPRRLHRHRHTPLPLVSQEDDRSALFVHPVYIEEEAEDSEEPHVPHVESPSSPTPSCVSGLRMQWHSLALSVRFRVFRTKRSIRHRLSHQGS